MLVNTSVSLYTASVNGVLTYTRHFLQVRVGEKVRDAVSYVT